MLTLRLLIIVSLLFDLVPKAQAQPDDVPTLTIVVGNYSRHFESVSLFFDRVMDQLSREQVEAVLSDDYNTPSRPFIMVVDTTMSGTAVALATSESPLAALSPLLESNFGYGFYVGNLDSPYSVDAIVGFSLYALGQCNKASVYLARGLQDPDPEYELDKVMAFYAGSCSLLQNDLETAAIYFQIADSLDSHFHFETLINLMWTYLQLGDHEKAFEILKRSVAEARKWNSLSLPIAVLMRYMIFSVARP